MHPELDRTWDVALLANGGARVALRDSERVDRIPGNADKVGRLTTLY